MSSIKVNISKQRLGLYDRQNQLLAEYPVSTSAYGIGNQQGSFQTPLGHHKVCEKIGDNAAMDEVYIGRQPQGQLTKLQQQGRELPDDIITARILRLSGQQQGLNQGPGIDSFERYIYIHGTADEKNIGKAVSHGCIRMRNQDIAELYEKIDINCDVWIED
ncbi:MAG: L,D-transpeptidase [Gammaproteobacteria bacterium]|nr:L,D-transpeptidase [Gammaproteobacteria bacterium]